MPTLPGPRVLLSNSQDDREQPIPGYYVEKELALMQKGADGTGFAITVAAAGTPQNLLKATGISTDTIGDITVDATTGVFTVKKKGKYLVEFSGTVKGVNSKIPQLSVLKNASEVSGSLRQWTEPASALFQSRALRHVLDCVPGDTLALGVDTNTNSDTVTFDGFCLSAELIESQE